MSRFIESRRSHSGYAEIAGGRAKKRKMKKCKTCDSQITGAKIYCGPCYATRLEQGNRDRQRRKASETKQP